MNWTRGIDYPEWMNEEGLRTLQSGYLQEGETPKEMYNRVCDAFSQRLYDKWVKSKGGNYEEEKIFSAKLFELKRRIFDYLWNNWLCLATPVASNLGTKRGLPISCYVLQVGDSTYEIYNSVTEMAMLTKGGGGVGTQWNPVRPRGTPISTGGYTEGIIPFLKVHDSAIIATSQGQQRRGGASANLSINHGDWHEFIKMRRPEGDVQRQCLNLHHCTDIPNQFMERLSDGIGQDKWLELLKTRMETGESYISYSGNIGRAKPDWYKDYWFNGTNICSEVIPFLKEDETFVCCLSSANISRFDEWKDDELFISDCIWFLNGILDEFIEKSENKKGFEKARNFAIRHRSIGLGWIGLHTYLQEHSIPFVSLQHRSLTNIIGKKIWDEGWKASKELCEYYEQPDVMNGHDYYNAQLFAIAPTTSNAIISGGISQGVEPMISNYYNQKSAKGTFIRKNPTLVKVLETYGKNTDEIWDSILVNNGSVQHFDWMNNHDKEVFLTFVEINQLELVKLAAVRQKYVDQAQSLNLCFPSNVDIKWLHQVHYTAWQEGIKTLYYLRTTSPLRGDLSLNTFNECVYCES